MLKPIVAVCMLAVMSSASVPAQAPQAEWQGERPPSADGTVPLTDTPNGPAKTALPEQEASSNGTGEKPGSPESKKAERIK